METHSTTLYTYESVMLVYFRNVQLYEHIPLQGTQIACMPTEQLQTTLRIRFYKQPQKATYFSTTLSCCLTKN